MSDLLPFFNRELKAEVMRLKKLKISNFRCFESLLIDLDDQLTVLVAKNGQGKSSVLDAIRIGLWPFVRGFDLARNPASDSGNNISIDDVRIQKISDNQIVRQLPCSITLVGNWDIKLKFFENYQGLFDDEFTWERIRDREAKGTKTKDKYASKLIKALASIAQDEVRNTETTETELPVLGYYGTGRLWSQKRLTEAKTLNGKQKADVYMRLFAYRDCLDPASSYKHFSEWFIWIFTSYREEQIKQSEKGLSPDIDSESKNAIQVVQKAINSVLKDTGWHSLEYSVSQEKSLVLNHDQYGVLKIDLLSDGIRGVLAMVGDIAYRCIKLNPHLGINAAKETHGIVMIDEVDMHLHPAWQQSILGSLVEAFPKIQFIVTTHSPQVVSTVPSKQIRIFDQGNLISVEAGTQGAESSRILKEIFGVNPRPQNLQIVKSLNRYLDLIDQDKWDTPEALTLRQALDEWAQGHEPELAKADVDIRMKEYQRQL